jgi:hypothetical protein
VNHAEESIEISTFPAEDYTGSNISCMPLMTAGNAEITERRMNWEKDL